MILKRKQLRPAGVGDLCVIKPDVLKNIWKDESYKKTSLVHHAEINKGELDSNNRVTRRILRSKKDKMLTIGDAKLVVITKNSIFKDYINVAIVCFRKDSLHGLLVREELSKNKNRLIHKSCLRLASAQEVIDIKDMYSYKAQEYFENLLVEKGRYCLNNFKWVGK